MNFIDLTTQPNGFPLESDSTLAFMQTDYQNAIKGLVGAIGANYVIVSGMIETGANVSAGWVYIDGDLVFFNAGVKSTTFILVDTWVQKANQNGTMLNRYKTKVAQFGSGSGSVAYSSLQRIETLQALRERVVDLTAFEPNVIVSGLLVTSVNTGASTLAISAGVVAIGRKFVNAPAYTGSYPVYIKQDGTWVNTLPSGSDWVKFDPYTSQRLADVFSRATSPVGDVRLRAALSTDFDSAGLGKWSMAGWAICNGANGTFDMRGRMALGYDSRVTDPVDNVYDSAYQTVGAAGGSKRHTLVENEIPTHNHGITGAAGTYGLIRRTAIGDGTTTTAGDSTNSGTEPDLQATPSAIPNYGGGQSHENRPPFRVLVYIQRI